MTHIRLMLESEAEAVIDLWNDNCLEAAGADLSASEAAGVLAALRKYALHPGAFCLVAEAESGLVGFLTAHTASHPVLEGLVGEIEELYVRPQARCAGIGSALVHQAVARLRQHGAGTMRVHACAESEVARAFWQGMGWEQDLVVYSHYEETM